jgi:hypothetical protein
MIASLAPDLAGFVGSDFRDYRMGGRLLDKD